MTSLNRSSAEKVMVVSMDKGLGSLGLAGLAYWIEAGPRWLRRQGPGDLSMLLPFFFMRQGPDAGKGRAPPTSKLPCFSPLFRDQVAMFKV